MSIFYANKIAIAYSRCGQSWDKIAFECGICHLKRCLVVSMATRMKLPQYFKPDGNKVISGSHDKCVEIWDAFLDEFELWAS